MVNYQINVQQQLIYTNLYVTSHTMDDVSVSDSGYSGIAKCKSWYPLLLQQFKRRLFIIPRSFHSFEDIYWLILTR